MKQLIWSPDFLDASGPIPVVHSLLPETDEERVEVLRALEDQGVRDGLSFQKDSIKGRLELPAIPIWDDNGALQASIVGDDQRRYPAWFWLIKWDDVQPRQSVWWGLSRSRNSARQWD